MTARDALLILPCLLLAACSRHGSGIVGDPNLSNSPQPGELRDAQGAGALQVDLPGRMSVLVQVLTAEGRPVADLQEANFRLYEGGQLVSASESQQRLLARPRVFRNYTHLLLDLSGSVAQTSGGLLSQLTAAHEFIDQVTQAAQNHVAISWFFGAANLAPALNSSLSPIGFTDDAEALHEAIDNVGLIQVTSTSTNLYGAFMAGLDDLDDVVSGGQLEGIEFVSLSLVTFTDGTDQAGLFSRAQALTRLNGGTNDYIAMTIGLGSEIDAEALDALGPDGFSLATDQGDLTEVFGQVGRDVRDLANSFYLVGYVSPKVHGSGEHTLTVEAFANGGSASKDYQFHSNYFSGGGGFLNVVNLPAEGETIHASCLSVVAEDKSLVAGSQDALGLGDSSELFVARLLTDGGPDGTYGNGGVHRITSIGPFDHLVPVGMVVRSNGSARILVTCGTSSTDPASRAAIVSLDPNGSLASSPLLLDPPNTEAEIGVDLAEDAQGQLHALTRIGSGLLTRSMVRRFLPGSLSLDPAYGTLGSAIVSSDPAGANEEPQALVLDAAGRALIAGTGFNPSSSGVVDLQVARLDTFGNLDLTFGSNGFVHHLGRFPGTTPGFAIDLAVDADERILIAGGLQPDLEHPFERVSWWRVSVDGTPDITFTGNATNPYLASGLVTLGAPLTGDPEVLFGGESSAHDLLMLEDGSSLTLGQRENARGDQDLSLWRLTSQGLFSQSYNATGFLIEDGTVGQASEEKAGALARDSTGQPRMVGSSTPPSTSGAPAALLWHDLEPGRQLLAPIP